jgi:DNA-binding NtrC family response regulator
MTSRQWHSTASVSGAQEVLIVEDEQISRRAMALLFNSSGFRAQSFATAEQALNWLRQGKQPQVAIVDFNLPGMNGIELIERMKTLVPHSFPILVTAADDHVLFNKLKENAVPYLRKPVDFSALLSMLSRQGSNN